MDAFLVCLIGVFAGYLIGWLWLELHWMRAQRDTALEQRNRAINIAADMAEAVERAGIDLMPELPNHPPPRTTGPAFRQNGGHLKSVQ